MRRCRLPNGKIMWLCEEHQLSTGSSILSGVDAINVKQANFNEKISEIHDHFKNSKLNTPDAISKEATQQEIPVAHKPIDSSSLVSNHETQLTKANSEDSIDVNTTETNQEEQDHSSNLPSITTAVINSTATLPVTTVENKLNVANLSASKPTIQSTKAGNSNDIKASAKQVNSSIDRVKNNANMPQNELINKRAGIELLKIQS